MPVRVGIWNVAAQPIQLSESTLANEESLEEMIVAAPQMLSNEWMLIGRQEDTGNSGRIDLLAIAPDGSLVLIELKRGRTPREVVAQALDYAGWVEKLRPEDIAAIYSRFAHGHNLSQDFRQKFGIDLDEETLNQTHQIVIVASTLDDSTERIVSYLSNRGILINVLCFQVFTHCEEQLLSRAWLLDPVRTQGSAATSPDGLHEKWNGEFYCNFGHGEHRSWQDATKFNFVCAGGGSFYSRTLQILSPDGADGRGDRVWVKVPGVGFTGVGRVIGHALTASEFMVHTPSGEVSILDVGHGDYHRQFIDDPERCEYFVPVKWLQVVALENAVHEVGLFGNQNTVCKPTAPKWQYTVERLKEKFPNYDK